MQPVYTTLGKTSTESIVMNSTALMLSEIYSDISYDYELGYIML